MRFKRLVSLVEDILNVSTPAGQPRADMFLDTKVLALGVVMALVGVGCGIALFFFYHVALIIGVAAGILIGIGAILSWRNQTIRIVDEETFVYTTFLGNKKTYKFADITKMMRNKDSYTLFVGKEKVHIDSTAVMSKRLVEKINGALAKTE